MKEMVVTYQVGPRTNEREATNCRSITKQRVKLELGVETWRTSCRKFKVSSDAKAGGSAVILRRNNFWRPVNTSARRCHGAQNRIAVACLSSNRVDGLKCGNII